MTTPDLLTLAAQTTRLHRAAGTHGGEYAGPCPLCGGHDRFRVQPHRGPKGLWTCRQCRDRWGDIVDFVMWRDGVRYSEACRALGYEGAATRDVQGMTPEPPDDSEPPSEQWQTAATRFADACRRALWANVGARALEYLRRRGLDDTFIRAARLGYNACERYSPYATWSLDGPEDKQVWLPRGIVIPWHVGGAIWKLQVRQPIGEPKYHTVKGSANTLYNVDTLDAQTPAVLVEGFLDALLVEQAAGDMVAAVASGTSGARRMRWIMRLGLCPQVLIALDNEDDHKPDVARAVVYWLDVLHPRARRWKPYLDDLGDMAQAGMDVRAWVEAGLAQNVILYTGQPEYTAEVWVD